MILIAAKLASTHERLVIRSDDTDVLVLLIYYCCKEKLGQLVYMLAGHNTQATNRQRYIDIPSIVKAHGVKFCESLPAAHALTGCDRTSSLHQIGKHVAYSKLMDFSEKDSASLRKFGIQRDLEADISSARSYVLDLYGKKAKSCSSLDQLRYFLASTTDKPTSQCHPLRMPSSNMF